MLYPVLIFLLATITILLLQRANVLVEYVRSKNDDNAVISIFALGGLLKYKYEMPVFNMSSKGLKTKKLKKKGRKEKTVDSERQILGLEELRDRYRYLKDLRKSKAKIIRYVKRHLKTDQFDLYIRVGMEDAFYTALASGVLWALAGILLSYIEKGSDPSKKNIKIESNFVDKEFNVDLYCIFKTKIAHIIVVIIMIFMDNISDRIKEKIELGGDVSG
jgi:hypothetical protein